MVAVLPADRAFVGGLKIGAVLVNIVHIFCSENDLVTMLCIFHILAVVALFYVLTVIEMITGTILQIMTLVLFECMILFECLTALPALLILSIGTEIY